MKKINIGLCGLGTVGSGTFNILSRNADLLKARCGVPVEVTHIGARRDNPDCDTGNARVSRDIFAVADDPSIDILVELIGGIDVAKEIVLKAIANGKHVVTANKALIAHHGTEIFAAAEQKGVVVAYEAAVAGGIPIIRVLREGLTANRILWLAGIINGTTNFILTEMSQKNRDFSDVLKEAQNLGYAEADPAFDIEGIDAAHKLVILAALAFGMPLEISSIYTEGISSLSIDDIHYADELGYCIKHLGIAKDTPDGIELRVHPTLIPSTRLIGKVDGVMNAVMVYGDAVGSTLYNGAGAGAEPTASSVISDIVDIVRSQGVGGRVPAMGVLTSEIRSRNIVPVSEIETAGYLRISAEDKPGVMSKIASILSESGISIESLIQKEKNVSDKAVPIILVTSRTRERNIRSAIDKIEALDCISGKVVYIRVETLG